MTSIDAAAPAPTGTFSMRRVVGFVFMVVGMFMAILDIQIVASSLTDIQAGLSASADEISWIQTSYLIAEVIMIPMWKCCAFFLNLFCKVLIWRPYHT